MHTLVDPDYERHTQDLPNTPLLRIEKQLNVKDLLVDEEGSKIPLNVSQHISLQNTIKVKNPPGTNEE